MTKHVWFLNAHPDDFNPGLGLALVLKDLAGYTVHAADFNRGERGLVQEGVPMEVCAATRVEEERKVCAGLGIEPVFLPAIDGESYASREMCEHIAELFTQAPPTAVITHWPVDVHVDHVMCGAAVFGALRLTKIPTEVYFYRQNKQCRNFAEDIYLPFDEEIMAKKCELLKLYVCQNGAEISARERIEDTYNGYRCGAPFAECYASFQLPLAGRDTFFTELARARGLL